MGQVMMKQHEHQYEVMVLKLAVNHEMMETQLIMKGVWVIEVVKSMDGIDLEAIEQLQIHA